MAIHVSLRNDNNYALKVNYQSIRLLVQLSEDNRQEIASLTPEEVADTVMLKNNGKDPTAKRIPLPIPIPSTGPKSARDSNWTALRDACQNAGMSDDRWWLRHLGGPAPFFDLRGEVDLLQNSHLYLPNIVSHREITRLSYFDIALGHGASE